MELGSRTREYRPAFDEITIARIGLKRHLCDLTMAVTQFLRVTVDLIAFDRFVNNIVRSLESATDCTIKSVFDAAVLLLLSVFLFTD